MIYRLDEELWFPHPSLGEEDGLIAVGGDLSPQRLILAYSFGFFPWYSYRDCDEPVWYCPMERFVIFPEEIHVSHSMRTLLNSNRYEISMNHAFREVMEGCANADGRSGLEGAWLGPHIISAYTRMHELGFAQSVEVWERPENPGDPHRLVGGLYGMQLRNAFFGESMFSLVPNASKLALIHLARHALEKGWCFIDCQYETPHLKSMGGRHISYDEYLDRLSI